MPIRETRETPPAADARASFDPQPTLAGELVVLRPLRPADFDALYAVARDPLVWEQHPAHDRWREPVFRALFGESLASGGALVAEERVGRRVIGSSRLHGHDAARREVEVGWTFLAREFWGGRYNGEMKRLMLAHAFRWVDRVIFVIGADNLRSRRAVERIGGVLAGTRTELDGGERVVYAITAGAFASGPLR
jgi:RimJ/RimL family protein N-acetyltransferase